MVLKPGESTTIRSSVFTMHEGMGGFHDFRIRLITNDRTQPIKEVTVLSNWIP